MIPEIPIMIPGIPIKPNYLHYRLLEVINVIPAKERTVND